MTTYRLIGGVWRLDWRTVLAAAAVGWRYALLALAAGPLTALSALTSLNRTIGPNEPAITSTGRTTP